jgi:hypothetical protein
MSSCDNKKSIFEEIVDQNWDQVKLLSITSNECESKDEFGFYPLHVALQDEAPEDVQLAIFNKFPHGTRTVQ